MAGAPRVKARIRGSYLDLTQRFCRGTQRRGPHRPQSNQFRCRDIQGVAPSHGHRCLPTREALTEKEYRGLGPS
jgi:hypothetical protein